MSMTAYLWLFNFMFMAVVAKVHAQASKEILQILGRFFPKCWNLWLLHWTALMASSSSSVGILGFWESCCNKASGKSQLILKIVGKGKARDWVVVKYRGMEMGELTEWKESKLKKIRNSLIVTGMVHIVLHLKCVEVFARYSWDLNIS